MTITASKENIVAKLWRNLRTGPGQSTRTELLDLPDNSPAELDDCFRDLGRINRYFGGIGPLRRVLQPLLPPLTAQPEINLLDIASGVADVPLALAQSWTRRGYRVNLTVVDLNPTHIELATQAAQQQQRNGDGPFSFRAVAHDIFGYEVAALGQFDFVTCSLAFHHFEPEQRLAALQMMYRQSSRAFVVNDLERGWFGYLAAHFIGLTITRNRLVRHDAPLSILRSFTPAEMRSMATAADLPRSVSWQVKRALFARLLLVGMRDE